MMVGAAAGASLGLPPLQNLSARTRAPMRQMVLGMSAMVKSRAFSVSMKALVKELGKL